MYCTIKLSLWYVSSWFLALHILANNGWHPSGESSPWLWQFIGAMQHGHAFFTQLYLHCGASVAVGFLLLPSALLIFSAAWTTDFFGFLKVVGT